MQTQGEEQKSRTNLGWQTAPFEQITPMTTRIGNLRPSFASSEKPVSKQAPISLQTEIFHCGVPGTAHKIYVRA